jgi:hypothetical protein
MCYNDGKFSMCALNVIFSNGLLTRSVKLRARMGLSWSSNRKQSVKGIEGVLTFFSIILSTYSMFEQLNPLVTPASKIRRAAKATALREINSQREQFRPLGIMADWDSNERTYRTFGVYILLGFTHHLNTFFIRSPLRHSSVTDIPKNG